MPIRGSASLCEVRPLYKSPRRPKFMDQFPFVIASCTYRDSSLTSEWPLNGNRLPPRVRSKGARVVQGAAMGFPLESTQEFPFASVSEEIGRAHVELQSQSNLVCRLLLEKKN